LSPSELDDEIRAELAFHLEELEVEFGRQGHAAEEAKALARERFGDMDRYATLCRHIKLRDRMLTQRLLVAVSAFLLVLTGLLGWQVVSLARGQRDSAKMLAQMREEMEALKVGTDGSPRNEVPATVPIVGRVVGADMRPLEGARVLAVIKTWPNGQYRQIATTAVTIKFGWFKLPIEIPRQGMRAVHIAVIAEGNAFESQYLTLQPDEEFDFEKLEFRLEPTPDIEARLVDSEGAPVAGATLFPSARIDGSGRDHAIYFAASDPIHRQSDAEGSVPLVGLATGDSAKVYLRLPDEDWREIDVDVKPDNGVVTIKVSEPE
jgi:hypothetical protein